MFDPAYIAKDQTIPPIGQWVLYATLGLAVATTVVLASLEASWGLAVPALLLAGALLLQLRGRPFAAVSCVVGGFVGVVVSEQGVDPVEVAYGLFYVGYMAFWYGTRLLAGARIARSAGDYAAGTWLVLGFTLAPVMGLLYGAELTTLREHVTGFWMLLLYFPVKEACRNYERASTMLLTVFLVLGAYVSIRTFMNYREILLAATVDWQVADARPGYNALQLVMALVSSLALLIYAKRWSVRVALVAVFLVCLGSLLIIKYRGFWVSCAFSFLVLVGLLDKGARRQVLIFGGIGGGLLIAVTILFFGDVATLLSEGIIRRFSTLGTAFSDDISLINRFTESRSALRHIQYNPILGHGHGSTFPHYSMVFKATDIRSHIHIGYIDILFKMGVWGGFCAAFLWIRGAWRGLALYRSPGTVPVRLYGLVASATLAGMVFSVMTESPWFQMNQMFGFVVLVAGAEGFMQRVDGARAGERPGSIPSTLERGAKA